MTTRVGIGFVLALLSLAATGCSAAPGDGASGGAGGSSGVPGGPSSSSSSSTGGPTGPQGQTIDEVEPNNGPGFDGMQSLGTLEDARRPRGDPLQRGRQRRLGLGAAAVGDDLGQGHVEPRVPEPHDAAEHAGVDRVHGERHKLVDSTGVAWVRCEPVSSGECF